MAILPHFITDKSDLICLSSQLELELPIWLVIQADLAHSPKIRKVADFLTDIVSQKLQQLSGQMIKP
ncbi:hypothetical protein XIS1_1750035 [Xenorhabdus innexi]|uniref:LysR substrate-binding domain-containing protein n=1 Tax=Xenorhabdus innexi TaxID=290109 RepID=A0A1N6MW78_9GAMM|nr:hypothetical protein XIS1_1750035 [Xenorhabdus innexi]